ncbi:branched-chain amino acid ABC transporter permease [Sporolactobacillus spathodeae]|uniref:Branched-chain amino acid transport system permease protein n=1 Tax=Sporolactobacillus spathodeae TaxID=1465502 RepID=A0ABS2Q8T2_9BACL|nr:branched-chain amino acid ABC transporter permease [Sporolactobacillus spathodeae]MBM7658193.1 branched-chain amino acid transport system permease protein [Sporolactobacillus spathodeae]
MLQHIIQLLPQVLVDGITLGFVYAVVAIGYTMVYGILELINFAHGDIFMTGAFIGSGFLFLFISLGLMSSLPALLVFLIVIILSAMITGGMGVAIERVAYRPLRKRNAPKLIALITSIGISFILEDLVRFIAEWKTGNYIVTAPSLFNHTFTIDIHSIMPFFNNAKFQSSFIVVLVVTIIMLIGLDLFVNKTKWGMAMRAVAQDRETASLMTINVNRVISVTFFVGSALGGATGVLFMLQYGTIDPYIGFILGIKAFTAAVLGGIGNIRGAMFGGLMLGLIEMFAAANLSTLTGGLFGSEYKDVFAFIILILVLIFKPEGLFGKATIEKV